MDIAKLLPVFCLCVLAGCVQIRESTSFITRRGERPAFENYDKIVVNQSSAASVLAAIGGPGNELLSQSRTVVASQGQRSWGNVFWVSIVAFDENELVAKRKYLILVDQTLRNVFLERRTGMALQSQMALDAEILAQPFANDNARRIEIVRQLSAKLSKDRAEVAADNEVIDTAAIMVNQALSAVLVKLDSSPVLAAKLSEPAGLEFEHISLGRGRARMVLSDDIAALNVNIGISPGEL